MTGELVWSIKADDHPSATITGTPALAGDKLLVPISSLEVTPAADPDYACCTFQGKVLAVNPETGAIIWSHSTIPDPPVQVATTSAGTAVLAPSGAPVWSSPAVDLKRNLAYFGTGENYSSPADGNSDAVIAVDLTTGERVWTRQSTAGDAWNVACMMADNPNCPAENGPDLDHGSSMVLIEAEGRSVLAVGNKNGAVYGLDPDNQGAMLWSTRVGRGSIQGGVHFGMAAAEGLLYAPINDMNDTRNGDWLDPELARPGVHAIDAASGEVMWRHVQEDICAPEREFCDPGVSAAVTAIPGAVLAGHLDGFLRAYSAADGEVLWAYDTTQPAAAVNGLTARGGGMSGGAGPGPSPTAMWPSTPAMDFISTNRATPCWCSPYRRIDRMAQPVNTQIIENGTVIDGLGNPPKRADVVIAGRAHPQRGRCPAARGGREDGARGRQWDDGHARPDRRPLPHQL